MPNSKTIAKKLFPVIAADLCSVRSGTTEEVWCPLCLNRFRIEAIDDGSLSVEHIIPSAVGGTRRTMTCTACNNTHGSRFDSNVVGAMAALDALEGNGDLPAVVHNDHGHVAANITWRVGTAGTTDIKIVGRASDPAGIADVPGQIYDGATLHLTLNFGFVAERYRRGVFRMAYLAAFEQLGYNYIINPGAALVRRILDGTDHPPEVILQAHPDVTPRKQAWLIATGDYLTAIIRLKSHVTRYISVFLPVDAQWEPLEKLAAQHGSLNLSATPRNSAPVNVQFTPDPVKSLLETRIPATPPLGR